MSQLVQGDTASWRAAPFTSDMSPQRPVCRKIPLSKAGDQLPGSRGRCQRSWEKRPQRRISKRRYTTRDSDLGDEIGDLIRSSHMHHSTSTTMTVTQEELEAAIRAEIPVTHVEVEDNSGGCGEKYSVLIVSEVR